MPSFIVCLNLLHAGLGVRHVAAIAPRPQQPARDLSQIANDRRGAALYYAQSRVGSDRDGKWFDRRCRYGTPSTTGARPWYRLHGNRARKASRRISKGAPNVVIVLIDDLGFGATSTFGGPIPTPTLDRPGQDGLRYNNFHTTALCSPTRAALKSGRNHHTATWASSPRWPPASRAHRQIPNATAPLAEILRLNGYSTAAFGKWHETAGLGDQRSGPFDRWPTRQGFDKFYGFIGGETNQWAPFLYDGTKPGRTAARSELPLHDRHDGQGVAWIKYQKALTPGKPFFVYFAPGATHAPHHVPKEWIAKWKGKFDQGWDKLREETLARQIAWASSPGTKLAPKPAGDQGLGQLSADEKRLFARQAEVFAAFARLHRSRDRPHAQGLRRTVGEAGQHAGLLHRRRQRHQRRRRENGMFNEYTYFNGVPRRSRTCSSSIDKWGGPETYPHMAAGWAVASTPVRLDEAGASDFGGTRNGMVVSLAQGHQGEGRDPHASSATSSTSRRPSSRRRPARAQGGQRHAADPDGRHQPGLPSTTPSARNATRRSISRSPATARSTTTAGLRARSTRRRGSQAAPPLEDDVWELYDVRSDFSLATTWPRRTRRSSRRCRRSS
jgi:hypothetical protein